MPPLKKAYGLLFVSALLVVDTIPTEAFAISAVLAKKCRDLTLRVYRPQRAGSRTGTSEAERNFFQNCVVHNGEVEGPVPLPVPAPANSPR
jgi:hypothetical protein